MLIGMSHKSMSNLSSSHNIHVKSIISVISDQIVCYIINCISVNNYSLSSVYTCVEFYLFSPTKQSQYDNIVISMLVTSTESRKYMYAYCIIIMHIIYIIHTLYSAQIMYLTTSVKDTAHIHFTPYRIHHIY